MEELFIEGIKRYGYFILFPWSIMEGEAGLVMAGLLCHTGDMNIFLAITVAALGGFTGDQIYFYLGRYNKKFILKKLTKQRRKFALAHLLLLKYGWSIIFFQRFIYGLRTVIPMSIGITRYDYRQYAFINLLSAFVWASLTIVPVYIFGEEILWLLNLIKVFFKEHWYLALIFAGAVLFGLYKYLEKLTKR
ncbi:MAG: DedA family protein [Helicobacteraceae bacterium]